MKFSELPIGAEFVFERERFCKVSPLMAHHAVTGASRLMHRSATVSEVGSETSRGARQSLPETVASQVVIAALDELCRELAKAAKDLGANSRELPERIEQARARFLRATDLAD